MAHGGTSEVGDDTAATVALGPTRVAAAGISKGKAGTTQLGSTEERLETPGDALDLDEARRTRMFALFAGAMAAPFALFILLIAGGDPTAKVAHLISLGLVTVFFVAVGTHLRDPARFRDWMVTALGLVGTGAVITGLYYWGRYAPILLIVPIALYTFALGRSALPSVVVAVLGVVAHALLTTLARTDVLPDVGLLDPSGLTTFEDLSIAGYVWFILIAVVVMGRRRRRASEQTLAELERAVRGIAGREALLLEAKQELERALAPGGPGRFTGSEIGGYTLGSLLGMGAIGEVYEAVRDADGEPAAVKLLSRASWTEGSLVRRFYRELEIAASLETPHVVDVLAVSGPDDPMPFLVMERLRGQTLADYLRGRRRLPVDEVGELLGQVCDGVGSAHAAGVVHRDLKPRNLFRHRAGALVVWKVLDFGVSKVTDGETLTHGAVVGTPNYMSPEQAVGGEVDVRSDVFALGVIAYRCLTGQPAFAGRDIPAILFAVTDAMPAQPSRMAPLPGDLDAVLAVAMAKRAEDRFASCGELHSAYRDAMAGQLGPELRRRAADLLEELPWGARRGLLRPVG